MLSTFLGVAGFIRTSDVDQISQRSGNAAESDTKGIMDT